MSESIEYALGALLLYGAADFVYKRAAAAGAEPHHFLMVQTWFFTPSALLYGLVSGTLAFNAAALWGAAAGVCAVFGYYNFAHSLRSGSVSTNATIFRLSGSGRKFDDVCCAQFGLGRGARREHPPPVGL